MIYYTNSLKKTCPSGQIFDKKYNTCIDDCNVTPNMIYKNGKCVSACDNDQIPCNNNCYSNNYKCLKDSKGNEVPCEFDNLCGDNCFNPNKQVCINNILYDTTDPRVCGNIYCDDGKICTTGKNKICRDPCSDGKYLCGDNCCDNCDSDKICGSNCCNDTQKCSKNKTCITCNDNDEQLCGDICYDPKKQSCLNPDTNSVCDSDKVLNNNCCAGTVSDGKTKCCNTTDNKYKVQDDKCQIVCGKDLCDPNLNQECVSIKNSKEDKEICQTINCTWGTIDYDPFDILDENNTNEKIYYPSCSHLDENNTNKYYITKQINLNLSRTVQTKTEARDKNNKLYCTTDDCVSRLAETNLTKYYYDSTGDSQGVCKGEFKCNELLQDNKNYCPFKNRNRCCRDSNGNFTGQVCINNNEVCNSNGICTTCNDDSKDNNSNCKYGKCSDKEDKCVCNPGWYTNSCDTPFTTDAKMGPSGYNELYIGTLNFVYENIDYDRASSFSTSKYDYLSFDSTNMCFNFKDSIKTFSKIIFRYVVNNRSFNRISLYKEANSDSNSQFANVGYDSKKTNYDIILDIIINSDNSITIKQEQYGQANLQSFYMNFFWAGYFDKVGDTSQVDIFLV